MLLKLRYSAATLHPYLINNLKKLNLYPLNTIQTKTLQVVQNHNNAFVNSQTGSGKTLCYLVPIINNILSAQTSLNINEPNGAIILTLTKQLCIQIYRQVRLLDPQNRIRISRAGSISYYSNIVEILNKKQLTNQEINNINKIADQNVVNTINWSNLDILVTTPVTFMNIYNNNTSNINPKIIAIDQADLLIELDKNVANSTRKLLRILASRSNELRMVNEKRQYIFTASSFPKNIDKVPSQITLRNWFPNIEFIEGEMKHKIPKSLQVNFIQQENLAKDKVSKYEVLLNLLKQNLHSNSNILIFCNSSKSAKQLVEKLQSDKIKSQFFGAQLKMQDRVDVLHNFQNQITKIIVATELLSRGFDFQVSLVIEYQASKNVVDYINRAGRTARFNKKGTIISFIGESDMDLFNDIRQRLKYGQQFDSIFSRKRSLSKKKYVEQNSSEDEKQ